MVNLFPRNLGPLSPFHFHASFDRLTHPTPRHCCAASLPLPEVRQHLVDLVLESVGVVGLVKMAEFMSHDVIDDGLRGHNALPVKGKHSLPRGVRSEDGATFRGWRVYH